MHRIGRVLSLVLLGGLLVGACSGSGPSDPGATAPNGGASKTSAPDGGDVLSPAQIAASLAALEGTGSWTFEAMVYSPRAGGDLTITGTERRQPVRAVAAQHATANGDFQYVRIGDDIWFDAAVGQWTQVAAGDADNLIDQYEPVHLAGLVAFAGRSRNDTYELVGREDLGGVATLHYRLSEEDLEDAVEAFGLTPDQWAGDVWIAVDGGHLLRYAWGPQAVEIVANTGGLGFHYDVTSVGCACPVDPPE